MKRWYVWVGIRSGFLCGISRVADRLLSVGGGRVFLLICLAVVVGACTPLMQDGAVQRGDLALDLPLEPAAAMRRQRVALPVQTTPSPLGSGGVRQGASAPVKSVNVPLMVPVKEFGIPARSVGHSAPPPSYVGKKNKPSVKKRKSTVKRRKSKGSNKSERYRKKKKSPAKRARPCPCPPDK